MRELETLLRSTRQELHKYPEISETEYETQKRIKTFLEKYTACQIITIAKTGVLAIFDGNETGKTVLLRADIDALPIQETNTFKHQSKHKGVSHKCGHDGHTTILLGVAKMLTDNPIKKGKFILLFQPAEENGNGAQAVLKDSFFLNLKIDYAFALHNLPGFPKHEIVIKENEFTSNVKSAIICLNGKTAHAAEPEKGNNPASAISEIIQFTEQENKNSPNDPDFFLATPIHISMGEKAYGISAGYGEVHLTFRSWDTHLIENKREKLQRLIKQLEKKHRLQISTYWFEEFFSNINNKEAVKFIKTGAQQQNLVIREIETPFKWGEDFGLFTQKLKGAMFGLGAGEKTPALHNPDYDFPDDITQTGISLFYNILKEIQK